jgi:hypothetical protein
MNKHRLSLLGGVALATVLGAQCAVAADARTDIATLNDQLSQSPTSDRPQGYSPVAEATRLRDDAVAALAAGDQATADKMARLGLHELGDRGSIAVKDGDDKIPNSVASGAWGMQAGIPASDLERGAGPAPELEQDGQAARPVN